MNPFIIEDYLCSKRMNVFTDTINSLDLPISDVLKYTLNDGSWICIRPSGTEPKVKVYFGVKSETLQEIQEHLFTLKAEFMSKLHQIID